MRGRGVVGGGEHLVVRRLVVLETHGEDMKPPPHDLQFGVVKKVVHDDVFTGWWLCSVFVNQLSVLKQLTTHGSELTHEIFISWTQNPANESGSTCWPIAVQKGAMTWVR